MRVLYQKNVLKSVLVLLTASVFYVFFLTPGDLSASYAGVPQNDASQTFSSQPEHNQSAQLFDNGIMFDFLAVDFLESGHGAAELAELKKSFLSSGSIKEPSRCVFSSEIMPFDSLPAYFFSSLRI